MINNIIIVKTCRFTSKELIGRIGIVISKATGDKWHVQFRKEFSQYNIEEELIDIHQDDCEVIGKLNHISSKLINNNKKR